MKQSGIIPSLLFVVLFLSCSTSPTFKIEPESPNATLVVGQVAFNFMGFSTASQINGIRRSGVRFRFEDEEGEDFSVLSSGASGIFAFEATGQVYRLKAVEYNASTGAWAKLSMNWPLEVYEGVVNNMGTIQGEWHHTGSARSGGIPFGTSVGHSELKENFLERYPESGWNSMEWENIEFF